MTAPTPDDRFDAIADGIVRREMAAYYVSPRPTVPGTYSSFDLRKEISAALRSMLPPKGSILDDGGVVRLIDTRYFDPKDPARHVGLPVFADGEVWMMNEEFYTIDDGEVCEFYDSGHKPEWTSSGWVVRWGEGEIELSKCWSTRAAAEAASAPLVEELRKGEGQ